MFLFRGHHARKRAWQRYAINLSRIQYEYVCLKITLGFSDCLVKASCSGGTFELHIVQYLGEELRAIYVRDRHVDSHLSKHRHDSEVCDT